MAYQVRWQLVGRSGQPLDSGYLGDGIGGYRDAVVAVVEFLRLYPEVSHCSTENYWLARRSCEADLAVWVWIERHETEEQTGAGRAWMFSREATDQVATSVTN
ncbi:hypothetical protein [Microvirga tunisiensis]|uniref:Uncharacterized protein n=1 Tax=Microvirga tunisiensis TaxID=2108360 RepID=A0A5N7MAS1_9HYPH|nr:hypothetical protein [Microvirga tunisiensis]MPR06235.1 hypothetical protein [Microvirga tunisiensis]MPR24021.1 hypothetical protein [Microvirga tunisiensis]